MRGAVEGRGGGGGEMGDGREIDRQRNEMNEITVEAGGRNLQGT